MFHEDFRVEIFGDGEDGKKRLIGVVEAVNFLRELGARWKLRVDVFIFFIVSCYDFSR